MAYGRVALGAARSVLRATPVGGAVDKVTGLVGGLFGKAPPDRNASNRLRAIGKRALAGDVAARDQIYEMAYKQGSKFATINAAAIRWADKLRANQLAASSGQSQSVGAGPAGIMASGGGLVGTSGPRRRRRTSSVRRASRPRRRRRGGAFGARRMTALQRKYFGKRRRSGRRRS